MKAILVRTGSGPIQAPFVIVSPKGSFSDHDSGVGISFPGRNSTASPRSVLHSESKEKGQFPTNFRRTLSDTDLIRYENSRFRSLNRVFSRSIPARIAEDEALSEESVDLQTEGEEDKGSSILKKKSLELGISGILPENEILVEELEFSGGGIGKGRKVGGGNGGGRGGDGGGNGDQNGIGAYYEEMLKANPGNPLLLGNYGKFLHEVEKDFERAEEYYGRAILANPEDGEILSLYGKLIWETQRDQGRARGYFDQAVNACPDDCYVLGSYARFMWDVEEDEEDEGETQAVARSSPLVEAH
ncbi:uncharacterized protein LOC131233849 [Magnolia sinica]|uniref:uncharacterized protein LOC131233849 n=1 Tax=Magnolia sinica TaxID=86752 RepID=UPI002658744E|nr:uncharacterized protein LOC131233849 [Magnolia sinica]